MVNGRRENMCHASGAAGGLTITPIIDVQLKANKVFCLIVNIPLANSVRLNSLTLCFIVWNVGWFKVRLLLGVRLGCRVGLVEQRHRGAADQMSHRWSGPQSASPGHQLLERFGKEHITNTLKKEAWKQSISKWDHLRHLNNCTSLALIFHLVLFMEKEWNGILNSVCLLSTVLAYL